MTRQPVTRQATDMAGKASSSQARASAKGSAAAPAPSAPAAASIVEMNQVALSHSLSLAMHNLVAQQQQAMILLNAITSRASKAILDGQVEAAERLIKLSKDLLRPQSFIDNMRELALLSVQISQQQAPENLAELEQWWAELARQLNTTGATSTHSTGAADSSADNASQG